MSRYQNEVDKILNLVKEGKLSFFTDSNDELCAEFDDRSMTEKELMEFLRKL